VDSNETCGEIELAIRALDQRLEKRVANVESVMQRQDLMLDEVERELDDIADERLRRRVLDVITRYDEARNSISYELSHILTHDLFDELRTLSIDIKLGL
jgi:hypothetical protein